MITAAIATITGREQQFKNVLESLTRQCHLITYEKDHHLGDAAKFIIHGEGYFFSCDDDIHYPLDYVVRMVEKLKEYKNQIIVTCLGRTIINQPITKYYKNPFIEKIGCFDDNEDTFVHIGGSGAMAFHTDLFQPDLKEFKTGYMADIWVSIQAQQKQIPILCMGKKGNWLQAQPTEAGIYEKYKDDDSEQVKAINSINWNLYHIEKNLL